MKRIKTIGPDEDPPWASIRPPGPRMTGGPSYVRSELGWALGRHYPAFECVSCACPCGEDDEPHDLTICYRPRRDGGDSAALTCEAGAKSDAVLEAILEEIS